MNELAEYESQTATRRFLESVASHLPPIAPAQEPSPSLFGEEPQQPRDLERLFNSMRAQGYAIGTPFRHYPPRFPGWQEWHVMFSTAKIEFALAWVIPPEEKK